MATTVKINIDPADQIMLRRGLNNNGRAQRFFTSTVRRFCDPYVPKLHGPLKNSAVVKVDSITYNTPYARRQYYEHKGDGLRGAKWDRRMWSSRGPEIVNQVANFVGGRSG